MKIATNRIQEIESYSQSVTLPSHRYSTKDTKSFFWLEWQAYRNHLYFCCLKWMKSNPIDAEDVLSQAMLKAWNEWQKSEGKIKHPKAWFTRITYNFCMDVHRKNKREALRIAKIEEIKFEDCPVFSARAEFPESNILDREMRLYLRHQIESLPTRLRQPFILYCCQEKSYQDIAKQLTCTEETVRKCVREARLILQKHLIKYIAGEDDTALNSVSSSLNLEIPLAEKSPPSSNWESLIPTKSPDEEISYQITVLCQETLPHHWYSSVNPLGWR
ncbi:MAG TPA: sigma-70 family RNA polymerase sigma factor [Leptolyngbyaceae cyanobacterium]